VHVVYMLVYVGVHVCAYARICGMCACMCIMCVDDMDTTMTPPQAEAVLGAVGGGFAAFVTTPFDIVTTRIIASVESEDVPPVDQTGGIGEGGGDGGGEMATSAGKTANVMQILKGIVEEEGVLGLFNGATQRSTYWVSSQHQFLDPTPETRHLYTRHSSL
jgi:hypothetical protein